jgi:hypothetical protein
MSCQIRKTNYKDYETLLQNVKKVEILFANEVFLEENFIDFCHEMEELEIYGSSITKIHDDVLKSLLLYQKKILKLELNCTILNSSFLSIIWKTSVQELYLTHLIFTYDMIDSLSEGLLNSKVKTLDLSHNAFCVEQFQKLCNCLPKTSIENLFLCCCHLTCECSFHLFDNISSTRINYLDLFQNNIGEQGVKHLCRIIPLTKLKFLDIGSNQLTDRSCEDLACILPSTKLQYLWLMDRNITHQGILCLFHVFPKTMIINFQYPFRLMNRYEFIPIFCENRKKIKHYNNTAHFRNFISLMECRQNFDLEVFFIPELTRIILSFL